MNGPSVLETFASKVAPLEQQSEPEGDVPDDLGAFGWLRGVRERALMLQLRMKDGRIVALGYAWLERVEFDPHDGITLTFAGRTVKLTGRNLGSEVRPNLRLLDGLQWHRVAWIQEADEAASLAAGERSAVVDSIVIE